MNEKSNNTPAMIFVGSAMIAVSILIAAFHQPPVPTPQELMEARMQRMVDLGLVRLGN